LIILHRKEVKIVGARLSNRKKGLVDIFILLDKTI